MDVGKFVKEELSGSSAKTFVSHISKFHRIQASPMFHEASLYVVGELRKMGLGDVSILQFPADGKRKFWTHQSSPGWEVGSAELRLLEPRDELLATFEETPMSLHTFSTATPEGGVTAELVEVGTGTSEGDYKGKRVRGKIVLATGMGRSVHLEAVVKRGAAGVITDALAFEFPKVRESIDIPDAHSYHGIWPTADNAKKIKFGFSVSKRQGNELRGYLRDGKKVLLRAKVDARILPGKYDVVTATIKGSSKPDEEIFLVAHLCHPKPGANDNASGSGLLMEIARVVSGLIKSGKMKRPARTIRFFWVPETTGTVALLSTHPEIVKKLVAGINLDMVGENQEMCRSTLEFCPTPDSLPSYLGDFVYSIVERSSKELDPMSQIGLSSTYRFTRCAYSSGSDNAEFVEPSVGVPCVSFTQWPDRFYHTSMDTIDRVSEDSLRRVGWMTATAAIELADADARTAIRAANLTCSRGLARIARAGEEAVEAILALDGRPGTGKMKGQLDKIVAHHSSRLHIALERERRAVGSVSSLGKDPEVLPFVDDLEKSLADMAINEQSKIGNAAATVATRLKVSLDPNRSRIGGRRGAEGSLVPKRLFKGTLDWYLLGDIRQKNPQAYKDLEKADPDFLRKLPEIVNFTDGRRSIAGIALAVAAEYGPTDQAHVLMFMRDLERIKLVSF